MRRFVTQAIFPATMVLLVLSFTEAAPELLGVQCAFAEAPGIPSLSLGMSSPAGNSPSIMSSSARMIGGLFLCLGVFAIGVRMLKRYGVRARSTQRRIEIRERVALSSKASLTLVAIDNKEFLVASGSESVSILPTHATPPGLFAESLDEVEDVVGAFNA